MPSRAPVGPEEAVDLVESRPTAHRHAQAHREEENPDRPRPPETNSVDQNGAASINSGHMGVALGIVVRQRLFLKGEGKD